MNRKVKAETPATNVSKIADFGDSKCYRINCECTSTDHSVDTWIETTSVHDIVSVTFYINTHTRFFDNIWQRLKCALNVLFLGVDEKQAEIIMNKQTAKNWISAVDKTINEIAKQNENSNTK